VGAHQEFAAEAEQAIGCICPIPIYLITLLLALHSFAARYIYWGSCDAYIQLACTPYAVFTTTYNILTYPSTAHHPLPHRDVVGCDAEDSLWEEIHKR
jgi:hypothetical protein